jgi:uncharacterized protein (TIGR01244 family)
MENEQQITPEITISGQPTAEELAQLREQGFKTVVNLRVPGEPESVTEEERLVEGAGLNYASIPVSPELLDEAAADRFSQALDSVGGTPALIHCKGGGRAGLLALMHLAVKNGWTVDEALEEGQRFGIGPSAASPYREFFESYIKLRSPGGRE